MNLVVGQFAVEFYWSYKKDLWSIIKQILIVSREKTAELLKDVIVERESVTVLNFYSRQPMHFVVIVIMHPVFTRILLLQLILPLTRMIATWLDLVI